MIKAKTGISNKEGAFEAGQEAAKRAKEGMAGIEPDLILVGASTEYEQEKILAGIDSVFPNIPLAGCSCWGGVATERGVELKGVAVLALKFERTKFAIASVEGFSLEKDLVKKGEELGKELLKKCQQTPKLAVIFLPRVGYKGGEDRIDFDSVLKGLKQQLKGTSIIGGVTLSEEMFKTGKWASGFEYYNKSVKQHSGLAIGFWGDFSFSLVVKHGWEPIGLEMKVTKAKPGFIQEIDGKPAIEIYAKYLGKTKEEILDPKFFTSQGEGFLYPLGIILKKPERTIVRAIAGCTLAGELGGETIQEGRTVRLFHITPGRIEETVREIGKEALSLLGKSPQVAIYFSCGMRIAFLMPDYGKEINVFKTVLGEDVPIFGMWIGGEICSKKEEREWLIHNQSIAMGLMSE